MSEDISKTNEENKTENKETAAAKPAESSPRESSNREGGSREGGNREGGPRRYDNRQQREGGRPNFQRMPRFKKKVCRFCQNKDVKIDYKKPEVLERFLTDRGKILPRRITGTCAKHQRWVATEIKKARMIALLPFVEQ